MLSSPSGFWSGAFTRSGLWVGCRPRRRNVVIDVRFLSVSALLVSLVFYDSLPLANDSDSGQVHKRAMVHDGVQREYFVFVPKSKKSIPPLVLGLHGYRSTATGFEAFHGVNRHAARFGYIAVYPQGQHFRTSQQPGFGYQITSWNDMASNLASSDPDSTPHCVADAQKFPCPPDCSSCSRCAWTSCGDDLGFIEKVLNAVELEFHTDPQRHYLLGVSNGGMMALRLGCNLSHRFAAIAPIIGQLAPGFACAPEQSVPMFHLYSEGDDTVRSDGKPAADGFIYETADDTLAAWAHGLSCASGPIGWKNKLSEDNGLRCVAYTDCSIAGHEAVSCGQPDSGHLWPGMSVKGAIATCATLLQSPSMPEQAVCGSTEDAEYESWGMDLIWQFFQRYTLRDKP